ncbi:MAG TPA: hypothetical protein VG388_00240 [Solirubrobacteraceae bacterium]|nr:hypothetical protein [Solirubrobacteraceae bacterium]
MWLYTIAFPVGIFIIVGSVLAGGVYTIVALPIVILALMAGVFWRALGRMALSRGSSPAAAGDDSGHGVVSPGELADARRTEQ